MCTANKFAVAYDLIFDVARFTDTLTWWPSQRTRPFRYKFGRAE